MLLFEHCTLESDNVVEIPRLVSVFGFKGLMRLLESGALCIICDYIAMGNSGQTSGLKITLVRGGARVSAVLGQGRVSPGVRRAWRHVSPLTCSAKVIFGQSRAGQKNRRTAR